MANTAAYTTGATAANADPLWTVAGGQAPSNFVGYDNGAHQGITFNKDNPAVGAKYVVQNYLQQNKIDPNSKDWGSSAATGLNALYGTKDLFRSTTGADGTSRLSYGDESVGSGGDSGGGNKGTFTWTTSGGGGKRPALSMPQTQPLFGASASQGSVPVIPNASGPMPQGLNTSITAPSPVQPVTSAPQPSLNVNALQRAINDRLTGPQ